MKTSSYLERLCREKYRQGTETKRKWKSIEIIKDPYYSPILFAVTSSIEKIVKSLILKSNVRTFTLCHGIDIKSSENFGITLTILDFINSKVSTFF